jgi:UDP:flavonoid glycosyltransferase YjiC (YdhE family)
MNTAKRILVVPLDWGLGHAARCVPLIRQWIADGHHIYLAGNGRSKALLKGYFPKARWLPDPPDYGVSYPDQGSFAWHMFKQVPKLLRTIQLEKEWLDEMIETYAIQEVVSDNRYGLYSTMHKSVIITHQTAPIVPLLCSPLVHRMTKGWNERFTETWIPDIEPNERSLGGLLSHENVPRNARYIGWLSRLDKPLDVKLERYDTVAVVSGPEPTRSLFQKKLLERLLKQEGKHLLVCGTPDVSEERVINNVRLVSHLDDTEMAYALIHARLVISRSGYSSLMDYKKLGVTSVELEPTPGQTEQIYLKDRFFL